jgi:CheY-like chemotaxis protein
MPRVRLVHWKGSEALELLTTLRKARMRADYDEKFDSAGLRECRADPPDVFVIDLSRMPSHGREIAIALRQSPKTKQIPIVFCDGAAEKVDLIRAILPDATYCARAELVTAVKNAKPLEAPLRPADMMNRYGSRTAAEKLGIKARGRVTVIHPPRNLNAVLGEMPDGAEFVEQDGDVTLCFLHSPDEVRSEISRSRGLAAETKLWFLWRKQSAPVTDGVTDSLVRETAIGLGLVDYKICAVDASWTAMAFARRK